MPAAIGAGLAYFAIVFAVGFVLGTVRALLLLPRVGVMWAVVLELPVILLASWLVCQWLVRTLSVPARPAPRLVMGGLAFALLMTAEAALATILLGRTPAEHLASYMDAASLVGLAGQLLFALLPFIQSQLHRA